MTLRLIKLSIMLALIGIFLTIAYLLMRQKHETIIFKDPSFETAIRNHINYPKGTISSHQIDEITILNIPYANIEYLDGIEAFSALRILNLEGNKVKDLSPLQTLNHLETLILQDNEITDLEAINLDSLKDLVSLRELNLRHNVLRPNEQESSNEYRISDISLLTEFTQLEKLILRDNHIQDISPLSSLTNLLYLDLSLNPLLDTELTALSNLNQLKYLNLRETNITDISVLTSLSSLTYLNLHSNINIDTLAPLDHLTNLETLIIQNVPVGEEIVYLSDMTNLLRLNIRNTGISDISVLVTLIENGALQDKPALGIYAELDLRENPIPILSSDATYGYNLLRDYWHQITYRYPYLLPLDPTREVIINEYLSSNGDTITDDDGDYSDWIELYNPTDSVIDISGYYFSDDTENPFRWQFPENTMIHPNDFLLIYASGKDYIAENGEIHTNFNLSRTGEPLILTAPDGITLIDQTIPIALPRNISYGRYLDGSDNWVFFDRNNITPTSSNNNATPYDIPDWLNPNT